jgi:TonB family protein
MNSNRVFQAALLISIVFHTAVLVQNSGLSFWAKNGTERKVELSYVKSPEEKTEIKREALRRQEVNRPPPPFVAKVDMFNLRKEGSSAMPALTKPEFSKPDIIAVKKRITLPPVDLDKINNPSYIGYYQIVREKIRRSAYQNYTQQETGEVYLSFIISSNGTLKETRLVEEKSPASGFLKDIALRSVNDAAPFPAFPRELDYPSLSFNVVISFEIE